MLTANEVTEIFYLNDEFSKRFDITIKKHLFFDSIHFVYKMRNNMKGGELPLYDRIMLRKRAVIESVNDELKNTCQIRALTPSSLY
jgi:hypothetical protein